jgi:hypothetical protein
MTAGQDEEVRDNRGESRFESGSGDTLSVLDYQIDGNRMLLTHTEVPPHLRGNGLGENLVKAALEAARARGLRVVPICPFVQAYVRRHPESTELIAD